MKLKLKLKILFLYIFTILIVAFAHTFAVIYELLYKIAKFLVVKIEKLVKGKNH